jgi:hypothetical protein
VFQQTLVEVLVSSLDTLAYHRDYLIAYIFIVVNGT